MERNKSKFINYFLLIFLGTMVLSSCEKINTNIEELIIKDFEHFGDNGVYEDLVIDTETQTITLENKYKQLSFVPSSTGKIKIKSIDTAIPYLNLKISSDLVGQTITCDVDYDFAVKINKPKGMELSQLQGARWNIQGNIEAYNSEWKLMTTNVYMFETAKEIRSELFEDNKFYYTTDEKYLTYLKHDADKYKEEDKYITYNNAIIINGKLETDYIVVPVNGVIKDRKVSYEKELQSIDGKYRYIKMTLFTLGEEKEYKVVDTDNKIYLTDVTVSRIPKTVEYCVGNTNTISLITKDGSNPDLVITDIYRK